MAGDTNHNTLATVTGVQLAQGLGVQPARGFWADAWSQVVKRSTAVAALAWLGVVVFFAVFAPIIANGHPLWAVELTEGKPGRAWSPMLENLTPMDLLLMLTACVGAPYVLLGGADRGRRLGHLVYFFLAGGLAVLWFGRTAEWLNGGDAPAAVRGVRGSGWFPYAVAGACAAIVGAVLAVVPIGPGRGSKVRVLGVMVLAVTAAAGFAWTQPLQRFNYPQREAAGELRAVYTVVPFSPNQRYSEANRSAPGTKLGEELGLPEDSAPYDRRFLLGTDALGSDVLSNMLHACRLSISIGFVSTGIALSIGVTLGALAGYFGGWLDLVVSRVIEVFMSLPVLVLLIIAAGVLPAELRTVYITMAIIGAVTWTGAARLTRGEFLKLRNQDFVQAARSMGLPLRSILFRHMLPNGVTPVLVDASFAIAAAILAEATLSYLGLGPPDSASWGKLLSSAVSAEGEFKYWLAVFPGAAIFLTVLAYNMLGEALRDAIDPKLKKARV